MNILFVCTGNIFRSMSAEYCLRDYLLKNKIYHNKVASAGTSAIIEPMKPKVRDTLLSLGIDPRKHKQTKLTAKHFEEYDLIVAMHKSHQEFIKKHFGRDVPLFDEICYSVKASVLDINDELIPNHWDYPDAIEAYTGYAVKFIYNSMPKFVANYKKFIKN
jgi:protein-tyrosine phosphatase